MSKMTDKVEEIERHIKKIAGDLLKLKANNNAKVFIADKIIDQLQGARESEVEFVTCLGKFKCVVTKEGKKQPDNIIKHETPLSKYMLGQTFATIGQTIRLIEDESVLPKLTELAIEASNIMEDERNIRKICHACGKIL